MLPSNWSAGLRDMVDMQVPVGSWPVLAWSLTRGEKVSKAISDAAMYFLARNGMEAVFAFISELPQGADEFVEVAGGSLIVAEWVPAGFVVLARGGMQVIRDEYKFWKKA